MNINDFSGAKVAVLAKDHVLTLLRDNVGSIPFPNMRDLPGGGRDGQETALDCAIRETFEEAKLRLAHSDFIWRRLYRNEEKGGLAQWFFIATPGWLTLPPPRLGDEGQEVRWMKIDAFMELDAAIPHLQSRLNDYLQDSQQKASAVG